jgi:hypothetical protein
MIYRYLIISGNRGAVSLTSGLISFIRVPSKIEDSKSMKINGYRAIGG